MCLQFFYFHQAVALQKLWKMLFISSEKLFLFLRYSNFVIFPSFWHFAANGQMEVEWSMISWIDLHKLTYLILEITQKPFYITSSNLVRYYITNKGVSLNFSWTNLKRDWSLVPIPFCFHSLVHWKGLDWKEKIKSTLLRLFDNLFSKYLVFKRISCMHLLF